MSCCGCGGGSSPFAASLKSDRFVGHSSNTNATTASVWGLSGIAVVGTATALAVTANPTSVRQTATRVGYVSGALINNVAGVRSASHLMVNGSASAAVRPHCGWTMYQTWAFNDAVYNDQSRMFCGAIADTAAPTAVDPATLNQCIGFGKDNGDTSLRFYAADAGANRQEVDLGANFEATAAGNGLLYQTILECRPNFGTNPVEYRWRIRNVETGAEARGIINTLAGPTFDQRMTYTMWRATGPIDLSAVTLVIGECRINKEF